MAQTDILEDPFLCHTKVLLQIKKHQAQNSLFFSLFLLQTKNKRRRRPTEEAGLRQGRYGMLRAAASGLLRADRGRSRRAGRGGGKGQGQRRRWKNFDFCSFVRHLRLQVQADAQHAVREEREHPDEDDRRLGHGRGGRVPHGEFGKVFCFSGKKYLRSRVFFALALDLFFSLELNLSTFSPTSKHHRSGPTPRRSCKGSPSRCGAARARPTSTVQSGSTPRPPRSL